MRIFRRSRLIARARSATRRQHRRRKPQKLSSMASRPGSGGSWSATMPRGSMSACGRRRSALTSRSFIRVLPRRSAGGSADVILFGSCPMARDALTRAWPVGEAGMAGAIRHAVERRVAAKAEIRGARRADRPAAPLLAQFEQRAALRAHDKPPFDGQLFVVERPQHLILQPRDRSRAAFPGRLFRARFGAGLSARQIHPGQLADYGVAADADTDGNLAAGKAGFKMNLQEVDSLGGPGR